MKNKILLSVYVCLLICGTAAAQKLPGKCKVSLPDYISSTNKAWSDWTPSQKWQDWAVARIKSNDFDRKTETVWKVYSDRAGNKTYKEPNTSSAVHSTLAFMVQLNVADVKNGFALVYSSDYAGMEISKEAKCFGWIPVDNLLLWEVCPQNHSKIYQKALVVHDPSKHGAVAEKNPPFFMEPDKKGNINQNQTAKDLDIYFVMKTAESGGTKYYLLSKNSNIKNSPQTVYGWIPEEYITEWDQRLLIEPTHESKTVDYYRKKNIYPAVFYKMDDAQQFYTNEVMQNPLWLYNAFNSTRMHNSSMRNPILERKVGDNYSIPDKVGDIYRVASYSTSSTSVSSPQTVSELSDRIELLKQAKDNINVIFVIDATSSMTAYFQSVADALSDVMKRSYNYPMKTGVVLYKGYKDSDKIAFKKITAKMGEISGFIAQSTETAGTSKTGDAGAMFSGLETALDTRKMGYESDQTNFIILITNTGNPRTDPEGVKWQDKIPGLARKMFDNRINFLAYQLNHDGSFAADDFGAQTGTLQRELAKKYRSIMKTTDALDYKLETNRLYVLSRTGNSEELPVSCSYLYASSGESETVEGLQKIIVDNISGFQNFVFNQLKTLEANSVKEYLVEEKLREILNLYSWNEKDIDRYIAYLKGGGATKLIGYASVKTKNAAKPDGGSPYQLFDYVLFFSENELTELIQQLSVINSPNVISDAKAFQDAIVKMGQAMLGQFSENDIRNMDMDKLLGQIYGIPVPLNLCGLDIKKIPNMEKEDLKDYIKVFRDKLDKLGKIFSDNSYDGLFFKNGNKYYWIPMEDMPGVYDDCAKLDKNY